MPADYLFALVVFLLPVAAMSGWYLGRKEAGGISATDGVTGMSQDYFRGLNYLLNDRPDKAIEVFIKVLEVESETVETHLALGNLFRRRGEVDRAIRIHQNLVARPTLEFEQRSLALLELGLDYMRSGLLDRAESLFIELVDSGAHDRQAMRHLIDIYQQEQDWAKALQYTRQLERLSEQNLGQMRAHYLCEQAELITAEDKFDDAEELLERALEADVNCVRANLELAALAMRSGRYADAIARLKQVEKQDLAFLSEAIGPLVTGYRALGRDEELIEYLEQLTELHAGITPVLVLAELITERGSMEHAKQHIVEELKIRPTVRGIDRLIDYSLPNASGEARENFMLLKEVTTSLIKEKSSYVCGNCGFRARSLHWQCPSCKFWNSIKPILGIEGE